MNDKQRRFCEEYVRDYNGAKAATRAGYGEKSARSKASQLLTIVSIKEYISELEEDLRKQCKVEAHVILNLLMREATDPDNPGSTRVQAQIALGKHIGLFTEKIEHSGDVEFNRIERVIVFRNEDGEIIEGDLDTGEEKKISKH